MEGLLRDTGKHSRGTGWEGEGQALPERLEILPRFFPASPLKNKSCKLLWGEEEEAINTDSPGQLG